MAYEFYMKVEGKTQGKFKGDVVRKGMEETDACFAIVGEIVSPRDQSSGMPTGKRQHKPLVVSKKVGASTPLFAQALCTNESLKSVVLTFVESSKDGKEFQHFKITLTDANVSSQRLIQLPPTASSSGPAGQNTVMQTLHEELSFTYQSITWEFPPTHKEATDDWLQSQG
jgi:type VI secretion system secreted protein Hcp